MIVRIRSTGPGQHAAYQRRACRDFNRRRSATNEPDPNLPANTRHARLANVITRANLVVDKSDDPDPVVAGTPLAYTVTLRNDGPSDARNAALNDPLPAGLNNARYCTGAGCTVDGTSPSWTGSVPFGTLTPGESREVRIEATVDPSVLEGTVLHNVASPASSTVDPAPSNPDGVEDTDVIARAELGITKFDDPDPVIAGNRLAYTIRAIQQRSLRRAGRVRARQPAGPAHRARYCVGIGLHGRRLEPGVDPRPPDRDPARQATRGRSRSRARSPPTRRTARSETSPRCSPRRPTRASWATRSTRTPT